jgi:retron-type reverse transcriptase
MEAAMPKDAPVNTGASDQIPAGSWSRVSGMQARLHRWAAADPGRRFDDLFNLVHDPATLIVAFDRVAGNHGANTPGVDGLTVARIEQRVGAGGFLDEIRTALKQGIFRPLPVRERKIPKPGGSGKVRKLGIPVIADRVVQAALKLVLEPIFEAGFLPVSYGFRPGRRAHDAVAEIHHFGTAGYRWVLDADIEACFDSISHDALMRRVRDRVKDKRVLALVKAFLKAGVLTEDHGPQETFTGTPQGGILTPPTQWATSALTSPWVTGGWNGRGVSRPVSDMSGSTFVSWLVAVAQMMRSMPGGSTRRLSWQRPVSRWRRPPRCWLPGSRSRCARLAVTWTRPWLRGGWRYPRRAWCSPSSCLRGWLGGCVPTLASARPRSPPWWPAR